MGHHGASWGTNGGAGWGWGYGYGYSFTSSVVIIAEKI